MPVNINTIETTTNIPKCMVICKPQKQTSQDNHLQQLREQIIKAWPQNKDHIAQIFRLYWTFQDNMTVIVKGRHVVIPDTLQNKHYNNSIFIIWELKKTKLLGFKYIYWPGIDSNIEKGIKICSSCLESQQMQSKEQIFHYKIPPKPWEVVGADMFTLHIKVIFAL